MLKTSSFIARKVKNKLLRALLGYSYGYKSIDGIDLFIKDYLCNSKNNKKSCDLGCGRNIRNPFRASNLVGIDLDNSLGENVLKSNLILEPIPLNSNSMDFITAYDFIEHVPRIMWIDGFLKNPFINIMDEIYRVLVPGGYFFHSTPAYPSPVAFQDPTHVNIITEDTMPLYFCGNNYKEWMGSKKPIASIYGFKGNFEFIDQAYWCNNICILTLMRKPLN